MSDLFLTYFFIITWGQLFANTMHTYNEKTQDKCCALILLAKNADFLLENMFATSAMLSVVRVHKNQSD